MVKYDKRNEIFKDFDKMLQEIMECEEDFSEGEISDERLHIEISDATSEHFSVSSSEDSSNEEVVYKPGMTYSLTNSRLNSIDASEDFPREDGYLDIQLTTEQLKKLNVVDRKEYKDTKNILVPNEKKKKMKKRCRNIDD